MTSIDSLHAREILDSRGNPTVEVDMTFAGHSVRAAVPSGASTGAYEAHELRDGDKNRYLGKGTQSVVENINAIIAKKIKGYKLGEQEEFDKVLIDLDGTENKTKLGANAILGVSMAYTKASAKVAGQEVFEWMSAGKAKHLPVPLMNVLNGGAHANNGLDVQEFMIAPVCGGSFKEALRAGSEIFHTLKKVLNDKGLSTAVGDEGGFAPVLKNNEEALELLMLATEKAGYKPGDDIKFALDVAATELYKDGKYTWDRKQITAEELSDVYSAWCKKFPLASIEDGFDEDDWEGWAHFTQLQGQNIQLVGDDLFVTNPKRLQMGIDKNAANALLVKVNQIGTITETDKAVKLAQKNNYHTVMSHRSGETEDTLIADLSVAMGSEQIKTGSLCRGERIAKYNQLLRIEEKLGSAAIFRGLSAFQYS